jgi:ribosomal protein S3AE
MRVLSIAVTEESVQLSVESETKHVLEDVIEEKGEI